MAKNRRAAKEAHRHMDLRLPTTEEIHPFDTLDERYAVEHFLGKDLGQAEALFREDFMRHKEDLMCMGPIAFRFYVPAALNFLLSVEEADPDDMVSVYDYLVDFHSFCSLIELRLEFEPAEVAQIAPIIREGIVEILNDFDGHGPDALMYGEIAGRYRAILSRLDA
jgi:hypothetical protein